MVCHYQVDSSSREFLHFVFKCKELSSGTSFKVLSFEYHMHLPTLIVSLSNMTQEKLQQHVESDEKQDWQ